jgi:hypothetical protein
MSVESPTDGEVFLAYLKQVLCPRLQPGQIVVMDGRAFVVSGLPEAQCQQGHRAEGILRLAQSPRGICAGKWLTLLWLEPVRSLARKQELL